MKEYQRIEELIQTSLTEPYWKLVEDEINGKESRLEEFQRRIRVLSRMKRDISSLESKIFKMGQDREWETIRDYLSHMDQLVELQLQLNRMLCHRQNGCSLNMEEYERVSIEIDCLERRIARRLEGRQTSV